MRSDVSKTPSRTTHKTPAKRSAEEISAIMRKVRGRDTTPELALRRALWARGLRYRVNVTDLPGKPDIVIPSARLAIFVDGDFWHGNQFRKRKLNALEEQFPATATKSYWLTKIRRNMSRDATNTSMLLSQGWSVLRFWESQLRADLEGCVAMVARVVEQGTASIASPLASRLPQRTVAEFFAGIGLMRIGLERQGWRVAFANDIDARKQAMYAAHFHDAEPHFVLGDVHALSAGDHPGRDAGDSLLSLHGPLAGRCARRHPRARVLRLLGLHPRAGGVGRAPPAAGPAGERHRLPDLASRRDLPRGDAGTQPARLQRGRLHPRRGALRPAEPPAPFRRSAMQDALYEDGARAAARSDW